MLEAAQHERNCFITLTYDEDNLPENEELQPRDLQLFMKRLRKALAPERIRYYGSGEYGEKTFRPHYHLAVFGMSSCSRGVTDIKAPFIFRGGERGICCTMCSTVRILWNRGHIILGQLEAGSAQYIAGYVAKATGLPEGDGRRPPFARMSNRPGIGYGAMDEVASSLLEWELEKYMVDVPTVLRHGKVCYPIGSYLRKVLREKIGREKACPKEAYGRWQEEMQVLRDHAKAIAPKGQYEFTLRGLVQDVTLGRRLQIEGRRKR